MSTDITAVMPVRNCANTLRLCLESLRGRVDRIIAVDHASTDATPDILREYKAKVVTVPFAAYITMGDALHNVPLDLAQTEYVLRIDADEILAEIPKPAIMCRMGAACLDTNLWHNDMLRTKTQRLARRDGVRWLEPIHGPPYTVGWQTGVAYYSRDVSVLGGPTMWHMNNFKGDDCKDERQAVYDLVSARNMAAMSPTLPAGVAGKPPRHDEAWVRSRLPEEHRADYDRLLALPWGPPESATGETAAILDECWRRYARAWQKETPPKDVMPFARGEHEHIPQPHADVTGVMARLFAQHAGKTALYVGAKVGGTAWIDRMSEAGITVDVLEVSPDNAAGLAGHGGIRNVIVGDIRSRQTNDHYSLLVWWHGPEHVTRIEFTTLLPRIRAMADVVAVGTPWGLYPQHAIGGNAAEVHQTAYEPQDLSDLKAASVSVCGTWGSRRNAPCGNIVAVW